VPDLDARLRITNYNAITGAPAGDDGKDLIFLLKANEIQKDIRDGAILTPLPGYAGALIIAFSQVRYTITVRGRVQNSGHSAHPVLTGVAHDPDVTDLEEAALTFNNNAAVTPAQLEIQQDEGVTGFRVYRGSIISLVLQHPPAREAVDFILIFAVQWTTSNPTFRGWV